MAGTKMILVVDMNWKKDSLAYDEFVAPILEIAQELDECTAKHYSELTAIDIERCNRIILTGTTLKDNVTLDQSEKFAWIKTTEKPVLGICAGMEAIGSVCGLSLTQNTEIGMTDIALNHPKNSEYWPNPPNAFKQ